jgi:hypothetical protein
MNSDVTPGDLMHTRPQHLRLIFWWVSERDVLCGACGCPELREHIDADFCRDHQREIREFQRWLAGTGRVPWQPGSSFESERRFLSARQRPA